MAIVTAYQLAGVGSAGTRLWHSLTLIPYGPWAEGVYWTLSVEIMFYLLVFAVIAWRGQAALRPLAIGLGLWSSAYILYVAAPGLPTLPNEIDRPLLLRYGVEFAVGMLLSDRDTARPRDILWLVAFVAVSVLGIVIRAGHTADVARAAGGFAVRFMPAALWLLAMAAILLSLRYRDRALTLPPVALRALRLIGLATYPLYLIHPVLGSWFVRLLLLAGASRWAALLIAVALLVGVAVLIAQFIEPRVRHLMRSVLDAFGGAANRIASV